MQDHCSDSRPRLSHSAERKIDEACDRFEAAWQTEQRPQLESHVAEFEGPERWAAAYELLLLDIAYREKLGEAASQTEYQRRLPRHKDIVVRVFNYLEKYASPAAANSKDNEETSVRRIVSWRQPAPDGPLPERVDRYRIIKRLGAGGFGCVYLAYDERLQREVAIKVPRADPAPDIDCMRGYLAEAQMAAGLRHRNIVDVYDAGQAADGQCFIVSKFIDGSDLKRFSETRRPSYRHTASMLSKIADALQHAHSRKLVHRDVKPSNILIDSTGEPFLADFGLALSDGEFGHGVLTGGTLAYMSPEQVYDEGHLVDGRSDIFSLGVVMYELLTGERPFRGTTHHELLERIKSQEVRPPRQLVASIPKELERICLKALSKRAMDRYPAATDVAEDLRHFLLSEPATESTSDAPPKDNHPKVVPKGLRSFDQLDADFFLQLLPGPRDRYGLPESIRSWKSRIEQLDGDGTFRVAVIYGPSGCGKSSFVRAGLMPRLAHYVSCVYIECNGTDDEQRLLRGLRKRHRHLDPGAGLVPTMTTLRRSRAGAVDHKTLVVVDQFEQWLHAKPHDQRDELISALRQCDAEHLQCIVLVRDDFWMAVSRFMGQLEILLVEGENSAPVDLFDPRHTRKVLADFGRAYGQLPESGALTGEQELFLQQAVAGLADEQNVIPVRLAVFAQMMKSRPWTPAALKSFGGAQGITTRFLEETFSTASAPPEYRKHRQAVQRVLRALLPDGLADIKGHMRARTELLEVSGYRGDPHAFRDLMRILDIETRLLTPIEPDQAAGDGDQVETTRPTQRYYHLTHDHLVQPLREWLSREQRATRRGRAELTLAERASLWKSRPEAKQLPSLWEWLRILLLVRRDRWTASQAEMMRATRTLRLRRVCTVVLSTLAAATLWWVFQDGAVRHHTSRAKQAWHDGDTTLALDSLSEAMTWNRDHRLVRKLLEEMGSEGGVTFLLRPNPQEYRIEIRPDGQADLDLGSEDQPRLISRRTNFNSGGHIRLAVGHYVISISTRGRQLVAFPFVLDREKHTVGGKTLELARQCEMPIPIPADEIPDQFAYVPPGRLWTTAKPSQDDFTVVSSAELDLRVHGDASLAEAEEELTEAFLIGKAETTRREFLNWWDRLGARFCQWRVGHDARIPEAIAETAEVPDDVQRECWGDELEKRGINADDLTGEEILRELTRDLRRTWATAWERYQDDTTSRLRKMKDLSLPVAVGMEAAIGYARTNARIEPTDFKQWVDRKIEQAEQFASQLRSLRNELSKQGTTTPVGRAELPNEPMVRYLHSSFEEQRAAKPVLDAYVWWLRVRTYYAYQVPWKEINEWAASEGMNHQLCRSTWLWKPSLPWDGIRFDFTSPPRQLVNSYAAAIKDGRVVPSRQHVTRWLDWMIAREHEEKRTFVNLREDLAHHEHIAAILDRLPFAIRYRYGTDRGWDLPTREQWEKAYRGADSRKYVWGNNPRHRDAHIGQGKDSGPLPSAAAMSPLDDVSPYGVLHMSGNMSEFVLVDQEGRRAAYLKGGNFAFGTAEVNYDATLSVSNDVYTRRDEPGGLWAAWTGFRVVKNISDPKPR